MAGSCARGNKSVFHKIRGTSRIASQEGLRSIQSVRQPVSQLVNYTKRPTSRFWTTDCFDTIDYAGYPLRIWDLIKSIQCSNRQVVTDPVNNCRLTKLARISYTSIVTI
jgi:hypothetical protein